MLQEIDATVAPTVSIKPGAGECGKPSTDKSAGAVIRLFALHDQVSVQSNPAPMDAERMADIGGLSFRLRRQLRLVDPLEDSLHILISAAVLVYLMIAALSL
jgi:hypothetical protein